MSRRITWRLANHAHGLLAFIVIRWNGTSSISPPPPLSLLERGNRKVKKKEEKKLTKASVRINDRSEGGDAAVGHGAQEGVDAGEPEARVDQALPGLLPLPLLDPRPVVARVVVGDARVRHPLLLGRQPAHLRRRPEERQAEEPHYDG